MEGPAWEEFRQAARGFVDLVAQVPATAWEQPGLGVWTVRELVGHTARSLTTVEAYLRQPAATVEVADAAGYFAAVLSITAPEAIAERGRAAGRALGSDPYASVKDLADSALATVAEADGDALLTTPAGGMRLADYLPTRSFELTVHSLDLARAAALEFDPPAAALAAATRLAVDLASQRGKGIEVLLGLTGREPLPAAFTVV